MLKDQFSRDGLANRGVVIHIGAGLCEELDSYLEAGFESVYLLEPNADSVAHLQTRAVGQGQIHLLPLAISAQTGRAALQILNFADLSSLRQPTALNQIMPGAHVVEERQVDTDTLVSVLKQVADLSAQKNNLLVIDAPGEELTIVEGLAQSGLRDCFQSLVVRCGQEAYFEGSSSVQTVLPALEVMGYRLETCDQDSDPDWPQYFFRLDVLRLENEALKTKNAALQGQVQTLEEQLSSVQAQLGHSQSATEALRGDLEGRLAVCTQELKTRTELLETLQVQLAQGQLQATEKHVALENLLATCNEETRVQAAEVETLQAQLAQVQSEFTQSRTEFDSQLAARSEETRVQAAEVETLQAQLAQVQSEFTQSRTEFDSQLAARSEETRVQAAEVETLQAQLAHARSSLTELRGSLEGQLDSALKQLKQAQAETADLRANFEGQLANCTQDLQTRTELLETVQVQLAQEQAQLAETRTNLERRLAISTQEAQAQTEKTKSLQEQLDDAQSKAAQTAKEHAKELHKLEGTLQRDLAVALRLQALARSDQQDLQHRFATLQAEKNQQEELLIKVTQKLGSAAKHLHQIAQQENLISAAPPAPIDDAEPAKSPKKKKNKTRKKGKKKSPSK